MGRFDLKSMPASFPLEFATAGDEESEIASEGIDTEFHERIAVVALRAVESHRHHSNHRGLLSESGCCETGNRECHQYRCL